MVFSSFNPAVEININVCQNAKCKNKLKISKNRNIDIVNW